MHIISKILGISIVVSAMMFGSICLYGKNKTDKKEKSVTTITFKRGENLFLNTKTMKVGLTKPYFHTTSVLISKPLNTHFKIESGIMYASYENVKSSGQIIKPYSINIPVSVQYYFLSEKRKLNPYIATGVQYQLIGNNTGCCPYATESGGIPSPIISQPGKKKISLLFSQGASFEVNTKIEITESIHFIPDSENNIFGIDLGVGFRLP